MFPCPSKPKGWTWICFHVCLHWILINHPHRSKCNEGGDIIKWIAKRQALYNTKPVRGSVPDKVYPVLFKKISTQMYVLLIHFKEKRNEIKKSFISPETIKNICIFIKNILVIHLLLGMWMWKVSLLQNAHLWDPGMTSSFFLLGIQTIHSCCNESADWWPSPFVLLPSLSHSAFHSESWPFLTSSCVPDPSIISFPSIPLHNPSSHLQDLGPLAATNMFVCH